MFFSTQSDFRDWLEANHDSARELWVGLFKKASGKTGITYKEAVDEALCFGWIDGIARRIDDERRIQRFTPRRRGSNWSPPEHEARGGVIELGLVHPAGLAAFERSKQDRQRRYSYEGRPHELDPAYDERFRANVRAWEFFQAQAPWYRSTATYLVMSAKREETRLRRFETLVADSEAGRRIKQLTSAPPRQRAEQSPEGPSRQPG
ncbi:MAG: bacteriocin-protection protein [Dehalococcoidia bacterium]|nr:bacteriocin-protection protein [Dehalococcoidia bacterium]